LLVIANDFICIDISILYYTSGSLFSLKINLKRYRKQVTGFVFKRLRWQLLFFVFKLI